MFLEPEEYSRLKEKYPKFNEPWTEDEDAELHQMSVDHVPLPQMAEQLQRTKNSIRIRLQKLGLLAVKPSPKLWSETEEEMVVQMYQSGASFEEMASATGRTVSSVVSRLVKLRISLFE